MLRSLQRAVYSPREDGHYALASDCYCHFTSPIRRYPDLTVHRLIEAILTGKRPRNDPGELVTLGEHCSEREQRAEAAERELVKMKLLAYMADRIGEEMDGVITGVESFGLFVQGWRSRPRGCCTSMPSRTITTATIGPPTRFPAIARATPSGWATGCGWPSASVDIDRRELDFRLVEAGKRRPSRLLFRRESRVTPSRRR